MDSTGTSHLGTLTECHIHTLPAVAVTTDNNRVDSYSCFKWLSIVYHEISSPRRLSCCICNGIAHPADRRGRYETCGGNRVTFFKFSRISQLACMSLLKMRGVDELDNFMSILPPRVCTSPSSSIPAMSCLGEWTPLWEWPSPKCPFRTQKQGPCLDTIRAPRLNSRETQLHPLFSISAK